MRDGTETESGIFPCICLTLGTAIIDLLHDLSCGAVIGSPPRAIQPHIVRVIDQSDHNTSLSRVTIIKHLA